jgi:saccharopine dehydrogenase-like NADP-dependent oxidoreductase
MNTLLILGAGKIGRMVCHLTATSGDYDVRVGDASQGAVDAIVRKYPNVHGQVVDFGSEKSIDQLMKGAWGVISCAPYHCNVLIAQRAKAHGTHYFDLTEDVDVTHQVVELAADSKSVLAPQCGLAPGFITIVANHLMRSMTEVTDLRLRVGALPRYPSNRLKYNLTWSTAIRGVNCPRASIDIMRPANNWSSTPCSRASACCPTCNLGSAGPATYTRTHGS